jgi:hypothetical protein
MGALALLKDKTLMPQDLNELADAASSRQPPACKRLSSNDNGLRFLKSQDAKERLRAGHG